MAAARNNNLYAIQIAEKDFYLLLLLLFNAVIIKSTLKIKVVKI